MEGVYTNIFGQAAESNGGLRHGDANPVLLKFSRLLDQFANDTPPRCRSRTGAWSPTRYRDQSGTRCRDRIRTRVNSFGPSPSQRPGTSSRVTFRLDENSEAHLDTTPLQNATPAQQPKNRESGIPAEVTDLIGGGAWTRTTDLRIMRPSL
jgi:hypothetical protein